MPEQKLYIGERYIDASSGVSFDTVNPANGEIICKVQKASASDVDKAVESARLGFKNWSHMTGTQRSRILMQAVALLRERNRELAELEVMDNGKPIQEADVVDVSSGADCIEYFAGLAPTIGGYKQSGLGRENSPAAIDHYTQLKSVYVEPGDVDCPYE